MANHPHYDPRDIARDAAVIYHGAIVALGDQEGNFNKALRESVKDALELHRLAWEACLPLNRVAAQAEEVDVFKRVLQSREDAASARPTDREG